MKPIVKISLLAGCILGVVVAIAVSLSLDLMMGDGPGGSWREAVRHDIGLMFGSGWASKQWFISLGVVIVIGGIGIIGAVIGAVFGIIVGKALSIMSR